jgi:hypothetical protein
MNSFSRNVAAGLALAAGLLVAQPALADVPGPHPGYVHALSDLRYAHWLLQFPAEWNVSAHERAAMRGVDRAAYDIRQAGIDDGKNVRAAAPIDANVSHRDRLVRALSALERARQDINRYESDPHALGARGAATGHLNFAIAQVRAALRDQHFDHANGF